MTLIGITSSSSFVSCRFCKLERILRSMTRYYWLLPKENKRVTIQPLKRKVRDGATRIQTRGNKLLLGRERRNCPDTKRRIALRMFVVRIPLISHYLINSNVTEKQCLAMKSDLLGKGHVYKVVHVIDFYSLSLPLALYRIY